MQDCVTIVWHGIMKLVPIVMQMAARVIPGNASVVHHIVIIACFVEAAVPDRGATMPSTAACTVHCKTDSLVVSAVFSFVRLIPRSLSNGINVRLIPL
jgi:hypothetical protein